MQDFLYFFYKHIKWLQWADTILDKPKKPPCGGFRYVSRQHPRCAASLCAVYCSLISCQHPFLTWFDIDIYYVSTYMYISCDNL